MANDHYDIVKWEGVKNCDTKQVSGGWLWIRFKQSVKRLDTNGTLCDPNRIYTKGSLIGFQMRNVKNRTEAIGEFFKNHHFTSI